MRIVSGIVNADSSISGGTGDFDVSKESTGLYKITFRLTFNRVYGGSGTQIFLGAQQQGGDTRDNLVIVSLESSEMLVKTGASNGVANDRDFTFIVTGD